MSAGADAESDPSQAELLERLRQSGIVIDREGRFVHEGAPIAHEGLRRALFRWLDRLPPPDGRHVLRLDERRFVYVDVEDTPLVARGLRWEGERAQLALSDGSEEPLDPDALTVDGAGVLRCAVRGGRLEARLATSAAAELAGRLADDGGRIVLSIEGRRVAVRPRQ
jgi:hypothetical protein